MMPEQQTLLALDLAFAPNQHVFTVTPHFDNWIRILQTLNAFTGDRRVLSGHGEPTDRSALDATVTYLRKGKEAYGQREVRANTRTG
jgi:glyoxylase-like metal-dependent hydrolase (beta-lactamase superfamily II)